MVIHHPDLLSNYSNTISLLSKIFTTLLLCIGGSPPSCLLLFAYKGLFLVCLKALTLLFILSLFNFSGEQSLPLSDVKLQPMDIADDIMAHVEVCLVYLEQKIIIVFSLHLGELLVLDLAILTFISLPYVVLHQFLCLISLSEFRSGW